MRPEKSRAKWKGLTPASRAMSATAIGRERSEQAIGLAKRANDRRAETVGRHSGRFAALALLPWQDAGAAVRELDRAVSQLGFAGALSGGH